MAEDIEIGNLQGHLISLPFKSAEGGDLHFLSLCEHEMLSKIVVADVAGHGEVVSRIAFELRNLLRDSVNETDNRKLLLSLNDALRHRLVKGRFVTMVAATFNGPARDFVYAYAGHPTLFRHHAESRLWEFMEGERNGDLNIPLGILEGTEYIQMKAKLDVGDKLLFYTDGLLDIKADARGRLNMEALLQTAQAVTNTHKTPREIATALVNELRNASGEDFNDDVTLLVVEVTDGYR